jgi:hypothetical protein
LTLLKFVDNAFILNSTNSPSNHSCIEIDFNLAKLLKQLSLSQK